MRPTGPKIDQSGMDAVTLRQASGVRVALWMLAIFSLIVSPVSLFAGWLGLLFGPMFIAIAMVAIYGARARLRVTSSGIEIRTLLTTRIPASDVLALEIRAAPRPRPYSRQIVAVRSGGKAVRLDQSTMLTNTIGLAPLVAVRDQMAKILGLPVDGQGPRDVPADPGGHIPPR